MQNDPDETENVIASHPKIAEKMETEMLLLVAIIAGVLSEIICGIDWCFCAVGAGISDLGTGGVSQKKGLRWRAGGPQAEPGFFRAFQGFSGLGDFRAGGGDLG
jgi:hypothetical protein